jgi:C-terminal processing protease CtpA/Prc
LEKGKQSDDLKNYNLGTILGIGTFGKRKIAEHKRIQDTKLL